MKSKHLSCQWFVIWSKGKLPSTRTLPLRGLLHSRWCPDRRPWAQSLLQGFFWIVRRIVFWGSPLDHPQLHYIPHTPQPQTLCLKWLAEKRDRGHRSTPSYSLLILIVWIMSPAKKNTYKENTRVRERVFVKCGQ